MGASIGKGVERTIARFTGIGNTGKGVGPCRAGGPARGGGMVELRVRDPYSAASELVRRNLPLVKALVGYLEGMMGDRIFVGRKVFLTVVDFKLIEDPANSRLLIGVDLGPEEYWPAPTHLLEEGGVAPVVGEPRVSRKIIEQTADMLFDKMRRDLPTLGIEKASDEAAREAFSERMTRCHLVLQALSGPLA